MKKLTLTLFGVVAMTAVSWGQNFPIAYSNLPSSIVMTNMVINSASKGALNFSGVSFDKASVYDAGPWSVTKYLANGFGSPGEEYNLIVGVHDGMVYVEFGGMDPSQMDESGNFPEYFYTQYSGPSLTNMSNASGGWYLNGPQPAWDAGWFVNGIGENGVFVGGVDQSGGGGQLPSGGSSTNSVSPQVTQTTDGLIMQSGEFIPVYTQQ